mmetsp:Transcript_86758/g.165796  ORF Transcript_86758/g.165796 Transcript_86758/m.165796 type:complete len:1017 (+) Transcript_86758:85-3135(+)
MAAAVPMMEAGPPSHISSSPRASAGIPTRTSSTLKPSNKSSHASPVLQFRQVTNVAAVPDNSVAASLTLLPATGSVSAPGHADSSGASGWAETQRRIEENVDSKITKVLEEIRTFVAQRIDAFMEKLRSEKLSRERSLLDVQRQLDDLAQRMGPGALVPFEDLARMTSAAASQLEASVDHAQRCCESACEAVQREVAVFRNDVEDHRAKHFAEIAALCANNLQTSNSEQQLKKSDTEVGLVEIRQELDDRCSAMSNALQLFSAQVERFQGQMESGDLSSVAKTDGNSLEEIKQGVTQAMAEFESQNTNREQILELHAVMEKRDKAVKQDIEALRQQQAASSAGLKEQLGQHLERTVDTAQAALMRSFLEEHKTLISSLLEERESRTQEVSQLNARMDRIVNDRNGEASANSNQPCEVASILQSEHGKLQDSNSLHAQLSELRSDMSSLRDRNDQLNSLFVGDAAVATKLVDELRESKRTWNVDAVRLQERLSESLQSLGAVQTQCKELQEWRENVDSQLSTSGQAVRVSDERAAATASVSGALEAEQVPKRLLQEMSALRGEVKTSLESAVTAVRLGEQLASELQAERQARRKDMSLIQGFLGKAATPRVSPPSQGLEIADTNVSNSALGFQARLLSRSSAHAAPNDSRERLPGVWLEASLPHSNPEVGHEINLDELSIELQRRLYDRVVGVSTVTEPASGSTSVPPAGAVPSSCGRTSVVSPLWPTRDVPRVPMLDLSATAAVQCNREGEPLWGPEHDVSQTDSVIASRRALQGSALWSSQSCHSVGSVALTPGTSGNAQQTSPGTFMLPMTVERLTPTPLASPSAGLSANRSMSSQRPRPAASPSTGGLRNIQPQPSSGLGVALSAGGPIRQQTLPAQRLPSSSSLAAAPSPGSVSVNVAHSGSTVHQAGLLQVRGPSPRMDGLANSSPLQQPATSSASSPLRSRQMKTSIASTGSPDRGSASSPLRQVSNLPFQGASLQATAGSASLRNSSPRMVPVARSVSPLRMSRRSGVS